MRCLDCAATGMVAEASAVCVDCGAGLCRNHLVSGRRAHRVPESAGLVAHTDTRWSRAMRCVECARTCSAPESRPWPAGMEADARGRG
ncbi:DUF2180 family protein [Amycolatopsis pigmentata]|uniref:DUF2180 family protein n=1 Tax=Amycolatopsis pigmentata TaxID=450801 RepID=A0ABW5FP25_9PSEU